MSSVVPPGTWHEGAAQALAETFDGAFGAPAVVTAAACIDETGTAIHVLPGGTPADGRFEIGSITKTMTATLLALLEADGMLRLDDEAGRWLSAGANGGITLRQLATHTSGLPRLAPNMDLRTVDQDNPWAGFGFEQAEEGLRQSVAAPGRPHRYSNLGYQLLGLVIERASGRPYRELITERLLEPLAMSCSGIGSAGAGVPVPGHANGGEVPHWDQPLGAAGVEATISDLARYARACLHPPRSPLGAAITAAQQPQVPLEEGGQQALGWLLREDGTRVHGGMNWRVLLRRPDRPRPRPRGRSAGKLRQLRPGARPGGAARPGGRRPPRGPPAATGSRMGRPRQGDRYAAA